jgi:O-acetylhomoserine (thiol)-lyase
VKIMHDETVAVHGGYEAGPTRAVAVPIYQTVAHDFEDAAHAGAIFDLEEPGFHYNRINNPTVDVLERRMAALERGAAAVALSSGAAAVRFSVRNVTEVGCNIVSIPQLYGATYTYFAHVLPAEGVEVRFSPDDQAGSIEKLIDDKTRAVFCESIGNPAGNVVDIEAVAAMAHSHGVPLIVDNTVATPLTLKPITHGADVVVHSLTKFVGGHGTTLGGIVVDGGTFPWFAHPDRFPMFNTPEPAFHGVVYAKDFPASPYAVRCRTVGLRNEGATLAPFNAFLLLQGLETLPVRLERHQENARRVAEYLAGDQRVSWVRYLGFADDPYHDLARRYLGNRFPSILTFGTVGGYDASIRFFNNVKLFKRLVNMGDAKSLVAHPASTTHRQLDALALAQVGISPEMIRLSVGLEHIDDIIEDLDQALGHSLPPVRVPPAVHNTTS